MQHGNIPSAAVGLRPPQTNSVQYAQGCHLVCTINDAILCAPRASPAYTLPEGMPAVSAPAPHPRLAAAPADHARAHSPAPAKHDRAGHAGVLRRHAEPAEPLCHLLIMPSCPRLLPRSRSWQRICPRMVRRRAVLLCATLSQQLRRDGRPRPRRLHHHHLVRRQDGGWGGLLILGQRPDLCVPAPVAGGGKGRGQTGSSACN